MIDAHDQEYRELITQNEGLKSEVELLKQQIQNQGVEDEFRFDLRLKRVQDERDKLKQENKDLRALRS